MEELSHAEYMRRSREIQAEAGSKARRLAVLASFNADLLAPYIVVETAAIDATARPWFSPFNQFEQVVLDPRSELWGAQPDVFWIALRLEDLDPLFSADAVDLDPERAEARLNELGERVVALAREVRRQSTKPILVSNFYLSPRYAFNIFDGNDVNGLGYAISRLNRRLCAELAALTDCHVFDLEGALRECGWRRWFDPKLAFMARAGMSQQGHAVVARRLARAVAALLRPASKCIVVDLDNTLWGGVLGDDGIEGLQLGDDFPGNMYKEVQVVLKTLRQQGFLLAIATKNDLELVEAALERHPEMVLRKDDFAFIGADWESKHRHLHAAAESLNIGLDSLVFIDDNPVERAGVRAACPQVRVVELPEDPARFADAIREAPWFDRPRVLAEDRARAQMYQQERQRANFKPPASGDLSAFLASLDMEAEVGLCTPLTLNRIHQLINKTNQFNLTTKRYQLDEIKRLADAPDSAVAYLRLQDRFGDMGLIAVGILRRVEDEHWEIDTLVMSCRVMGRNVEDAFLAFLSQIVAARGGRYLKAAYAATERNHMVKDFYPQRGFDLRGTPQPGVSVYATDLAEGKLVWPQHIRKKQVSELRDASYA